MKTLILFLLILSVQSFAAKDDYTLFNPTPESELRKFRTERPDKTRTAYTVDAGHLQLESELITFSNNSESKGIEALRGNFRLGLTNHSELQLQLNPFQAEKEKYGHEKNWRSGIGNFVSRYKYNFIGNDSGPVAIAIMPFITWPSASAGFGSDNVEYGAILPFDFDLSETWRSGAMLSFSQIKNGQRKSAQTLYEMSWSLSHFLYEKVWVYGEMYHSRTDSTEKDQITTADFVVQYEITEKFNMDIGTFLGLTESSEKQVYFVGASWFY